MNVRKILKIIFLVLILALIVGYVFFQGYDFIRGPVIEITSPANGSGFDDPIITIEGTAKNISFLYLNGEQIFADQKGYFGEKLLLHPGYNIMTLRATDKFNREVKQELHLILRK